MASLFKRPGSAVWQCQYYEKRNGELRQVRRSTGKRNKKLAQQAADDLERLANRRLGSDTEDAATVKRLLLDAVASIEKGTFNVTQARRTVGEILRLVAGETMPHYTIRGWIEEWLARKARVTTAKSMLRYRKHGAEFIAFLGIKADSPLESMTATDARKWQDHLQDSGLAGKTINGKVKDMRSAMKAAVNEGIAEFNPFAPLVSMQTADSTTRAPFTLEEFVALLEASSTPEWRGVIMLGGLAGMRLSDAATLRWSAVDFTRGEITYTPSKTARTGKKLVVPMHPTLHSFLESMPVIDDQPDAPIFPTLARLKPNSKTGLSAQFIAIMAAAGVDRGEVTERKSGRTTFSKSFHSLRHTFVSWLAAADVDLDTRKALAGHTTDASHSIYTHQEIAKLAAGIARLPKITP